MSDQMQPDPSRPVEVDRAIPQRMSADGHEELYRLLLDTSIECPLPVLGNILELISTVVAKRLHDEVGEIVIPT